jgi:hypothetical protein
MLRRLKAANAKERSSWRGKAGAAAANRDVGAGPAAAISLHRESPPATSRGFVGSRQASSALKEISKAPAEADVLSSRAENILKCLAADLTGEDPPKGRWTPSPSLLRKIGYSDLQGARNCGPQTVDEIVRWARSQGVVIERPFHAGKSLSTMWQDIVANSSAGEFTTAEIAEALERSIRRKNARIPVPVQALLLDLLKQAGTK